MRDVQVMPRRTYCSQHCARCIVATLPDHHVLAGDLGAVVEVHTSPSLAYEVEFVNPDGSARALLTLAPDQVRRLSSAGVLTTRQPPLAA